MTTNNSNVSPEVYIYAESRGVNIQHWQAQYKMENGSMHVDFGYKKVQLLHPFFKVIGSQLNYELYKTNNIKHTNNEYEFKIVFAKI